MAAAVENYQLKWHSHESYIHGTIATLQKSHYFTDVTLCTLDGTFVRAHRFILSACSKYFHRVLRQSSSSTNSLMPLTIVMPSDIQGRTLDSLIEYIYCGEVNINSANLDNVLKAGELLKIKGLYVEKEVGPVNNRCPSFATCTSACGSSCRSPCPSTCVLNTKRRQVNTSEAIRPRMLDQPNLMELRRKKNHNNNSEPAYKPKMVMTNQENSMQLRTKKVYNRKEKFPSKRNAQEAFGNVFPAANLTPEINDEKGPMKNKPKISVNKKLATFPTAENIAALKNGEIRVDKGEKDDDQNDFPKILHVEIKEEPIESPDFESHIQPEVSYGCSNEQDDTGSQQHYARLTCDVCGQVFTSPQLWVRHTKSHKIVDTPQTIKKIKKETENDCPNSTKSDAECKELHCELCQESFSTPAAWVKHTQTAHTNEELAIKNRNMKLATMSENQNPVQILKTVNKNPSSAAVTASVAELPAYLCRKNGSRLICEICNKSFPSQASIMIHIRTHTGETPYECSICQKGFNVKSNLLRHIRSVHGSFVTSEAFHKLQKKTNIEITQIKMEDTDTDTETYF